MPCLSRGRNLQAFQPGRMSIPALAQYRLQSRQQRVRQNLRTLCRWMNPVLLDRARNMDQILVNHRYERGMVLCRRVLKHLLKLVNVIGAVVGRQGDAGEQNLDVRRLQRCQHLVQIALCLFKWQSAQSVVAAKLDDHNLRVQFEDQVQIGNRVLGGRPAGSLIAYPVEVALALQFLLQKVRIRLARVQPVSGSNAVAKADQHGPIRSPARHPKQPPSQRQHTD
jgi:hypothetical protein